jgi:hypothetical protein
MTYEDDDQQREFVKYYVARFRAGTPAVGSLDGVSLSNAVTAVI